MNQYPGGARYSAWYLPAGPGFVYNEIAGFFPASPSRLGDAPLSGSKYQIGFATVVMLVLLRLNIGWHFFSEGVSHYTNPHWSSEGFLRAAKGPLAPRFQAVLPDYYGFDELRAKGTAIEAENWFKSHGDRLAEYGERFAGHYHFDAKQQVDASELLAVRQKQLFGWITSHKEDIATHFHERDRIAKTATQPTAEAVPFQKKRIADKSAELNAEARGWIAQVKEIEDDYRTELANLRTPDQLEQGPLPGEKSSLQRVDQVMTYGILGIGACLIVGLFTRLACVLGAAFLLSVVLTQPFWITDTQPTFNQWVELIALLALATTNVGKWGGLDFFLSCILGGCCGSKCQTK